MTENPAYILHLGKLVQAEDGSEVIECPVQKAMPMKVPVETSDGQTVMQWVFVPIQEMVGTATMPKSSGLIENGESRRMDIIQFKVIQMPDGQQALESVSLNPDGTLTIDTVFFTCEGAEVAPVSNGEPSAAHVMVMAPRGQVQQQQGTQPQEITVQGSAGQQFPVMSTTGFDQSLGQVNAIPMIQDLPGIGSVQFLNTGSLAPGQSQNVPLQHTGSPTTLQNSQAIFGSPMFADLGGLDTSGLWQGPWDPANWPVINPTPLAATATTSSSTMEGTVAVAVAPTKIDLDKPKPRVTCRCINCATEINVGKRQKGLPCHIPGCGAVYRHLKFHLLSRPGEGRKLRRKGSSRSGERRQHCKIHTGEKRFLGHKCGNMFLGKDQLSEHVRSHAKKEMSDNVQVEGDPVGEDMKTEPGKGN